MALSGTFGSAEGLDDAGPDGELPPHILAELRELELA